MSKLRADITYSHRLYNDPLFVEPTIDIDNINQDSNNSNIISDPADNLVPVAEDSDFEEPDDEANESQLENEFAEFLQGWVDMLREEENAELDEDSDEDNRHTSSTLANITHPAIDVNAKWELEKLFKDNIGLPF